MGRKGRCVKKNKQVNVAEAEEIVKAPHTFVLHRGTATPNLIKLTKDFRRMMEPFTAAHLKERKSNKIKDFVNLSGIFHVSHICLFNEAQTQISFKILRMPRGPTLTFKVHQFSLTKDVIGAQIKSYDDPKAYLQPPLVIMNSFSGEGKHIKLMAATFQNMFPTINLKTVKLANIRRCVLISYNQTTKLIDLRHFLINVVPTGLKKNVKKVILGKIPNLSKCEDIADYIEQNAAASDTEFEDDDAEVILPQQIKTPGNMVDNKSSIVLHELGPRITFQLIKIEEEILNGEVLYHDSIVKTDEEIEILRKEREKKKKLKAERKKLQTENKQKKEKLEDDRKRKIKSQTQDGKIPDFAINEVDANEQPDDDAEYFREEVGIKPDEDLFSKNITTNNRPFVPKQYKYAAQKRKNEQKGGKDNKRKGEGGGDRDRDNDFKRRKTDFGGKKRTKDFKSSKKGGGSRRK